MKPDAILIAGPTASGKSALAVRLARAMDGIVVNTDALQVYDGLRILTARPTADEMGGVQHRLYGHVPPTAAYSVARWRREVEDLLAGLPTGCVPVFCGGTGLYFRALLDGLDDMPAIPDAIRDHWRDRAQRESPAALHEELRRRDADAAGRIRATDPQRIVRALELIETSGKPLAALQARKGDGLFDPNQVRALVLTPDRAKLRERIRRRFELMVEEGAVAEASAFTARYGQDAPLAAKAIGLTELTDVSNGTIAPSVAVERAVTRTRQYAKRQETWFRNQFGEHWQRYADPLDVPVS